MEIGRRCKRNHEDDWRVTKSGYICRQCARDASKKSREKKIEYYRQYSRDHRKKNLDQLRAYDRVRNKDPRRRLYSTVRKYNLTIEQFEEICRLQNNKCAICSVALTTGKTGAHVDHDHSCCDGKQSCGKCVRGILCAKCSIGIARFNDDINLLSRAIAYLTVFREEPN